MDLLEVLLKLYIPVYAYSGLVDRSFPLAAAGYLVLMAGINFRDIRKGFLLPICSLGGFAVYILVALAFPEFKNNPWLVSSAFTCLAALASLALKEPFTIQYARLSVPKEKWDHPVFYRVNWLLTAVWSAYFLISFVVNVLSVTLHRNLAWTLLPFIVPAMIFTVRFPAYYRKKHGAIS